MANDNSNVTWKTVKAYTEKFKNWIANNFNTTTPHIDETTKNWFIGDVDTGILAEGTNGTKGTTYTPIITENGELAWENDGDLPNPTTTPIQTLISTAPLGTVLSFAGSKAPNGYLLCDGASYKVADYPDLYAVIGNTYGGDTENFNVPNLIDKFIQGSTTSGEEKEAGLPNITGGWMPSVPVNYQLYATGAVIPEVKSSGLVSLAGSQAAIGAGFKIDASKSSAVYGKSTTVQPPALTMVYIIKAFHTNEGVDSGVSDDVINYVDANLGELSDYSTEEKVIGKWIDGKPIYRKVYKVTNITTNLDLSELNIADIITINGSLKQTDESVTAFPYLPNEQIVYDKYLKSGYYKSKTKEWIWQFGSTATTDFSSGIFIIEYTKTTD